MPDPVLYLVGCTAPPIRHSARAVELAQKAGWDVCLVLTPRAAKWMEGEIPALEKLTGHPVRSDYKMPDEDDVLPAASAMLAAPATLNTLSKWAMGMPDTLALGLLTEAIGKRLPLVALPYINAAQAEHPALSGHIGVLERSGVKVLLGDGGHVPHQPGQGDASAFPWQVALECLAGSLRG
jgi:phosphopantothenoylcysteine synthetase/decarboxylase